MDRSSADCYLNVEIFVNDIDKAVTIESLWLFWRDRHLGSVASRSFTCREGLVERDVVWISDGREVGQDGLSDRAID